MTDIYLHIDARMADYIRTLHCVDHQYATPRVLIVYSCVLSTLHPISTIAASDTVFLRISVNADCARPITLHTDTSPFNLPMHSSCLYGRVYN